MAKKDRLFRALCCYFFVLKITVLFDGACHQCSVLAVAAVVSSSAPQDETNQHHFQVDPAWADECTFHVRRNSSLMVPFEHHHKSQHAHPERRKKRNQNKKKNAKVGNNDDDDDGEHIWFRYSLGDCVRACECRDLPKMPHDSLLWQYHKRACEAGNHQGGGNLTVLDEIFNDLNYSFPQPDPEALLIHMRLGDMMEDTNVTVSDMLLYGADPIRYKTVRKAIKGVPELLANIQEANSTKVEIVGGSHMQNAFRKSRQYALCVKEALERSSSGALSLVVSLRLDSGNPDEDFYYVSHARKIVTSVGGYSHLLGRMVRYYGGQLFGRDAWHKVENLDTSKATPEEQNG